jgi:hypothetical protein
MVGLPFFDQTAPQPVRAPAVEITLGGAEDSGGFGGLADAAASLLGGPAAPSWDQHLISLSSQQGFAAGVDQMELLIADLDSAPRAVLGDAARISMGATGALQPVFSGEVIAVEQRGDDLRRYRLGNGSHQLAQGRINQSVSDMSVQDIIGFAIGEIGLSLQADVSGSDAALSQYVLNDARTLWDHLAYLAGLRGMNLWFDADNQLQLADQLEQGDSVATFTRGEDILEANLWQRAAHSGAITAFGGSRVDGGFTLRKQAAPNRATAGDGPPRRFYRDGPLQTQQELSARAGAAQLFAQRSTTAGQVLVPGSSVVTPGSVIELAGLGSGGDGSYLVKSVGHRLDPENGWVTRLDISEAGSAGGLSGLLGGLL